MLIFAETVFDMTHLIDSEKLTAEIKRLDEKYRTIRVNGKLQEAREADLVIKVLHSLSITITSLQQEQPEVDLEGEIRDYFSKWDYDYYNCVITMGNGIVATLSSIQNVARFFYELGLKARKEE